MRVLFVGNSAILPRRTLQNSLASGINIEFRRTATEAVENLGSLKVDALILLNHELLPLLQVLDSPCSILFSPDALLPEVSELARQLGVRACLEQPQQLDQLDRILSAQYQKLEEYKAEFQQI